jgi:adenine-specific DNA-methyltransferase
MKNEVFNFLTEYSSEPFSIDKLIVSAYLSTNNLKVVNNIFLKSYLITESEPEEYAALKKFISYFETESISLNLETLIELFEFVVSPVDKVINGAIYTPSYIRNYIVQEAFSRSRNSLDLVKACDISCGCGGFLLTIATHIHQKTKKPFLDIYKENIYGLDITDYSVNRSKILLAILALEYSEDANFKFNLQVGNALTYKWINESVEIKANNGFDVIVGNPPYVASRNMEVDTLNLMSNWSVSKTGHPDLYIPFFQIGYEALAPGGSLGYITVNTFMKSINGRALREFFAENQVSLKIINFGGEQVFKGRNTYTCLCFISKTVGSISYFRTQSDKLLSIAQADFYQTLYSKLNHKDGWNLVNTKKLEMYVQLVESTGKPFKDLYTTKNGIATLKNDVYKFVPVREDNEFYFLKDGGAVFPIEKRVCRDIVNANKLKTADDILTKLEKIIFPYLILNGNTAIIKESDFRREYPKAFEYLLTKREILATRDKGKREYEEWYAFGRRQSMDIDAYKLFFPHICERPTFVISEDRDLLFYNGIAVIADAKEKLITLQKILESDVFFEYIKATTKDYASGYISMSRNYLKNFGVYQLNENEKSKLLKIKNSNSYVSELYQLSKSEIVTRS